MGEIKLGYLTTSESWGTSVLLMLMYLRSLVSQRANEGGDYCLITVMDC